MKEKIEVRYAVCTSCHRHGRGVTLRKSPKSKRYFCTDCLRGIIVKEVKKWDVVEKEEDRVIAVDVHEKGGGRKFVIIVIVWIIVVIGLVAIGLLVK